jgi:5-methylcytosine-specific restriction endonuclease McrA
MTSRICATPGCGLIIPANQRRCARHESAHQHAHNTRPIMAIYRDPRWPLCRQATLARDGHRCTICGHHDTTGKTLIADHHPTPALQLPDPFDPDTCRTLCRQCSGTADAGRARKGGGIKELPPASNPVVAHREKKRVEPGSRALASDRRRRAG